MRQSDELLTVVEFAQALKVKQSTVRKWVLLRKVRYFKPKGKLIRIPSSELAIVLCEVPAIIRTVNANPGQITIIAIGPLTNVAMAIRQEPGLTKKIKKLAIMGGAIGSLPDGAGNTLPNAEFNFWVDPEAAHVVVRSEIPISLTPLNVTAKTNFSKEWFDKIVAANTPLTNLMKA